MDSRPPAAQTPPARVSPAPAPPAPETSRGDVARTAIAVLGWGFRVGAAALVLGLFLATLAGEPLASSLGRPGDVAEAVLDGDPNGVIDLAILWMVAVPIITAVAIAGTFARAREWRYTAVTLLVLAVLGISISLAVF